MIPNINVKITPYLDLIKQKKLKQKVNPHLLFISTGYSTGRSVSAVKSILKIDPGFPNQIIWTNQVPIQDLNCQHGVLRESGLNFKTSGKEETNIVGRFVNENIVLD